MDDSYDSHDWGDGPAHRGASSDMGDVSLKRIY